MSRAQGPREPMTQKGFTLVELMVVVVIIGVLAVVAMSTFRKYGDNGRAAEAMAMIGEIKAKQEAYKAEYNTYLSTTTVGEADLYPTVGTCSRAGETEPCAKTITRPASWTTLGIAPNKSQLYCGYVTIAGTSAGWGVAGAKGKLTFANTLPSVPWFYVYAECDNNRRKTTNTTYVTAGNATTVVTYNDHD